jgi:peptidoglycan/xylan/chitin deacetylase (PgdA/CDA1 family)
MLLRHLLGTTALALLATITAGCGFSQQDDEAPQDARSAIVARPPQFVILSFDGSYTLSFWRDSRTFAAANDLKFTYFISGVYFIPNEARREYIAPRRGPGVSAIGWGGTPDEIAERFEEVKMAAAEGHEIASHANGHFDGSAWSASEWTSEFDQFDEIIFEGVGVTAPPLGFGARDIVGFRAPQLGRGPGLYEALRSRGYAYDASRTARATDWPEKIEGIWNFPLAELRIVGSGRATLSMDYNFYVADSRASPDPAGKERYKKQMIDTYMAYFEGNYFGNRAPLHIGHHFSKWNDGAYWEAMQAFAMRVCGLPEVTCGTYKELVQFVEEHEAELRDFQAGQFPPMPRSPTGEP